MLLAGDIGGTTVRLALVSPEREPRDFVREEEFNSADCRGLEPVVEAFLGEGERPSAACISVAGPVIEGRAHLTNLSWDLDQAGLAQALGMDRVDLLNDLACMAHALPHLEPDEYVEIIEGEPIPKTPLAVVAPGTGLGEAFLVWQGERYIVCSSEGGHGDFAPNSPLQAELWAYLAKRHGHVSYERACSGLGLSEVYEFCRDKAPGSEPAEFRRTLEAAAARTPLIIEAGLKAGAQHPAARQALQLFVEVLGAEAANLFLKVLATGGVFLGGGLPPRLLPLLQDDAFRRAFTGKGRFTAMLEKVPVRVVTTNAALLGAAIYGLELNRAAQAGGRDTTGAGQAEASGAGPV